MSNHNLSPSQFSVPIPEGTNIRRSGGLGQMPGDETNSVTKMVPISTMKRYVELDRLGKDAYGQYSHNTVNDIANEIKQGGVIREPLMLMHSTSHQWGYLGEGHHRLLAAEKAGLTHVPVSVFSVKRGGEGFDNRRAEGRGSSLTLKNPRQWAKFPEDTYQPRDLHPDHFAEL